MQTGPCWRGYKALATIFNGSGCANIRTQSLNNDDKENLVVLKVDQTLSTKDSLWYKYQQDTGLQAAYTDPINAIFTFCSPQPQRTGVTHVSGLFCNASDKYLNT
jgi:hypothetical protein